MSAEARPKRPRMGSAAWSLAGLVHPGLPHPVHIKPPPLRTANGHYRDERHASWLELFFDLVFAGGVGQLAGALQDHPTLPALGRFALVFTPIWWLWVQLSFYADRHESGDVTYRGAFLAAMLLCIGLAASAPRAMAGDTTGFVVAFVLLRSLQLVLYARARRYLPATRQLYSWYLVFFAAGGALWLASLAVPVPLRYAFRAAGLFIDAVGALAMLAPQRRVPLNTAHLADRFRLFMLIVLGESVARLISAAAQRPWSVPLAAVLAAALITLAALWLAWLTARWPGRAGRPTGDSALHRREPAYRGRRSGGERRAAPRHPGRRRSNDHPGRTSRRSLWRRQHLPARHGDPAIGHDHRLAAGSPCGHGPGRDGPRLHGRHRATGLSGSRTSHDPRTWPSSRGPSRLAACRHATLHYAAAWPPRPQAVIQAAPTVPDNPRVSGGLP